MLRVNQLRHSENDQNYNCQNHQQMADESRTQQRGGAEVHQILSRKKRGYRIGVHRYPAVSQRKTEPQHEETGGIFMS